MSHAICYSYGADNNELKLARKLTLLFGISHRHSQSRWTVTVSFSDRPAGYILKIFVHVFRSAGQSATLASIVTSNVTYFTTMSTLEVWNCLWTHEKFVSIINTSIKHFPDVTILCTKLPLSTSVYKGMHGPSYLTYRTVYSGRYQLSSSLSSFSNAARTAGTSEQ